MVSEILSLNSQPVRAPKAQVAPHAGLIGEGDAQDAALRKVAKDFETAFVSEMLKAAKIGEVGGDFTGGHGEDAFRSFLTREYAQALSDQDAFGLADTIYAQLKQKVATDVE